MKMKYDPLIFSSALLLYLIQEAFYLILRKGLLALGALIEFIGHFIIYEIFGEIHAMELDFEVLYELEILILTIVTQKVVLDYPHFLFLPRDDLLKRPGSGHGVFTLSFPFLQYFFWDMIRDRKWGSYSCACEWTPAHRRFRSSYYRPGAIQTEWAVGILPPIAALGR